jgi:polysaccharide export outer membrane protein
MNSFSPLSNRQKQINQNTSRSLASTVCHGLGICVIALMALTAGCQSQPQGSSNNPVPTKQSAEGKKAETLTLREGDVIKISFPGAPNLDSVQTIRRDGKIALALVGEVQAAGLQPNDLQAELLRLYAPQLVTKEVSVSVVSSTFPAFVSGAVLRPGKIISDHRITVLEAIMEAGGPDYAKANLKAVVVIRQNEDGKTQNYTVNVKSIMEGVQKEPFYLEPSDIVFVPERFAWL